MKCNVIDGPPSTITVIIEATVNQMRSCDEIEEGEFQKKIKKTEDIPKINAHTIVAVPDMHALVTNGGQQLTIC